MIATVSNPLIWHELNLRCHPVVYRSRSTIKVSSRAALSQNAEVSGTSINQANATFKAKNESQLDKLLADLSTLKVDEDDEEEGEEFEEGEWVWWRAEESSPVSDASAMASTTTHASATEPQGQSHLRSETLGTGSRMRSTRFSDHGGSGKQSQIGMKRARQQHNLHLDQKHLQCQRSADGHLRQPRTNSAS